MGFQSSVREKAPEANQTRENVHCALAVTIAAVAFVGLAFGVMMVLASPDGWVMKAASQAMTTAQQGTLASYDVANTN